MTIVFRWWNQTKDALFKNEEIIVFGPKDISIIYFIINYVGFENPNNKTQQYLKYYMANYIIFNFNPFYYINTISNMFWNQIILI